MTGEGRKGMRGLGRGGIGGGGRGVGVGVDVGGLLGCLCDLFVLLPKEVMDREGGYLVLIFIVMLIFILFLFLFLFLFLILFLFYFYFYLYFYFLEFVYSLHNLSTPSSFLMFFILTDILLIDVSGVNQGPYDSFISSCPFWTLFPFLFSSRHSHFHSFLFFISFFFF